MQSFNTGNIPSEWLLGDPSLQERQKRSRAEPIFPVNFFEKQEATKSKEQNSGKIGEKLEKWVSENCNLAYFALQR